MKGNEYPKMLYKGTWEDYENTIVKDAAQEQEFKESGWKEAPEAIKVEAEKPLEEMTREEIDDYSKKHFGVNLPARMKRADMLIKVEELQLQAGEN